MIEITVLYPNKEGARFDYDYYINKHFPFIEKKFAGALKGYTIKRGVGGLQPGSQPAYLYICHLLYESPDAFFQAFAPIANDIVSDTLNYTNIEPVIQM